MKAGAFYAKWLPQLAHGEGSRPGSFDEFGPLATHVRYVERASRKLARTTFYAMTRYQARLEQKQEVLGRIVDIGAELFAISSAAVYAQTIAKEQPQRAESAQQLADVFCKQARRRADDLFAAVFSNDDDPTYKLAQQVLDGTHVWVEEGIVDPAELGAEAGGPQVAGQQTPDGETAGEQNRVPSSNGDAPPLAAKIQ